MNVFARVICLLLASVAVTTSLHAQGDAATIAGKWTLTSEVDQGGPSALTLLLEGKKVTGRLVGPSGDLTVTGEYADGTLTFTVVYQSQVTVQFTGTSQKDGSLAGTLEYGQGPKTWKAVREPKS